MRKLSEMYVASRMQNMVQIHAWNACFATIYIMFFVVCRNSFGALGVESPHSGAMVMVDKQECLPSFSPEGMLASWRHPKILTNVPHFTKLESVDDDNVDDDNVDNVDNVEDVSNI